MTNVISAVSATADMNSVKYYGAVGDGFTDDSTAIQSALNAIDGDSSDSIYFPKGDYNVASTLTLYTNILRKTIRSEGARIFFNGTGPALRIRYAGSMENGGVKVEGLVFHMETNSSATAGIIIEQTARATISQCTFHQPSNPPSGWVGAIVVQNLDSSDDMTGSYWTTIRDCNFLQDTLPSGHTAIKLHEAANATVISGNSFHRTTNAIVIASRSPSTTIANSVVIQNNWFEFVTNCITVDGGSHATYGSGIKIENNRIENYNTFLIVTNRGAVSFADPMYLSGNYTIGGVGNYISTDSTYDEITSLDAATTPERRMRLYQDIEIRTSQGAPSIAMINKANTNYYTAIEAPYSANNSVVWYGPANAQLAHYSYNSNILSLGSGTLQLKDDTKRLGIGTNNPQSKLHVSGNATIDGTVTASGALNGVTMTSGTVYFSVGNGLSALPSSTNGLFLFQSSGPLIQRQYDDYSPALKVHQKSTAGGDIVWFEWNDNIMATISTNGVITAKNITYSSPRWVDAVVSGMALRVGGTSPARTLVEAGTGIYGTGFDANDDADFALQLQHGTASTNSSFPQFYYGPHVHVSPTTLSGGTNFAMKLTYQVAYPNSSYSNSVVTLTNWVTFTNTSDHILLSFGNVTNNLLSGRDSVVFRGNIGSLTNDTGGRVIVDSMDFHFPLDSVGSTSISGDAP